MKKFMMLMLLLALSVVLAACGSSDDKGADSNPPATTDSDDSTDANDATDAGDATGSAASEVTIEASNWDFDQEVYTVKAGEVTITLSNTEGMHGIQILDTDVAINGNDSVTATLEPGEYDIICSIPCGTGHADMLAKLVVE